MSYLWSLPERLIRVVAALVGGLLYQLAGLLLPAWLRDSRLYKATFARLLRIIVEMLGGVGGVFPDDSIPVAELAARKAAGNAVELIGFAVSGWSPVWMLAAASDVAGGTRLYLDVLVGELKAINCIPADLQIESVSELLRWLEGSSGALSDTIDMPPLNVEQMRETWQLLQSQAVALPDPARLAELYGALERIAAHEGRSLWEISMLVGVGALRTTASLGRTHLFDYYAGVLQEIGREGLLDYLARITGPYARAVALHLNPRTPTLTARLLGARRQ